MSRLPTPIICVVIGEGGSGGALGIGIGDRVSMLEHAYYSVISPEGCAGILWKEANDETKPLAAEALQADRPRPVPAAASSTTSSPSRSAAPTATTREMANTLKAYLLRYLRELRRLPVEELLEQRYQKFRRMGVLRRGPRPPSRLRCGAERLRLTAWNCSSRPSTSLVLPFWFLMIVLPHWRWTRRLLESAAGPGPAAAAVHRPGPARLPDAPAAAGQPRPDANRRRPGHAGSALVGWVHFLALRVTSCLLPHP